MRWGVQLLLIGILARCISSHRPTNDRDEKELAPSVLAADGVPGQQASTHEFHQWSNVTVEMPDAAFGHGHTEVASPSTHEQEGRVRVSRHTQAGSLVAAAQGDDLRSIISNRDIEQLKQQAPALNTLVALDDDNKEELTVLQAMALKGWKSGIEELVRLGKAKEVDVNEDGPRGTALACAIQAQSPATIRFLISNLNASVLAKSKHIKDFEGGEELTPLEVAARLPNASVVKALLNDTDLEGGLARYRKQLDDLSFKQPSVLERMLPGREEKVAAQWKKTLPKLKDIEPEMELKEHSPVGEIPANWILHYENKIMAAFVSNQPSQKAEDAIAVLDEHGFATFMRGMSESVLALFLCIGFFGTYAYVIFQFRVYGGPEAPVALSHHIIGAFNPGRVADSDFDPARQTATLPYKSVLPFLSKEYSAFLLPGVFVHSIIGTYSAWCLQSIRIPMERDPFDEDYLEEDDDEKRQTVRDGCRRTALRVRALEIAARGAGMFLLFWWFSKAERSNEVCMLLATVILFGMVAAATAAATVPAPAPEQAPNDCEDENTDSASLTYALFSVQYGPRWTRTVSATRHSAHPGRPGPGRPVNRRRGKRPQTRLPAEREDEAGSGGERLDVPGEVASASGGNGAESEPPAPSPFEALPVELPERLQKQLVKGGVLHIKMDDFMPWALFNFLVVAFLVLWLTHARITALGTWKSFYKEMPSLTMFKVYGAPKSLQRWKAVLVELLFLGTVAERLYALASLLLAAFLCIQQRQRGLEFAAEWRSSEPPDGEEATLLTNIRCADFVLELSTARWQVLRLPVLILYIAALFCFAGTTAILAFQHSSLADHRDIARDIEPLVPLSLGLVLATPLFLVVTAAQKINREVLRHQQMLRDKVEGLRAQIQDSEKQESLRLKANEILKDGRLMWPGNFVLGMKEPVLLVLLPVICVAVAVAGHVQSG